MIPLLLLRALAAPSLPFEGTFTRAIRWTRDRRTLAELDDRLLRDIGLTRADVARGSPFKAGSTGYGR
ncbi:MAG TPA: DUF1127 domain-containing protein [Geminicoccus sp.]|uniref:DUF1127 domain-containing protein n=1 Tax=Geminicoccus sp. TaxID=2024832 RepID=UPI002E2F4F7B|nr:DUF1127 domain-containing protein [Geminicoccus sp.]HEX2524881.1 DUF1127 domain-containing protein [Geminicoccus sp.]